MKKLLILAACGAMLSLVATDVFVNNRTGSDTNDALAADRAAATFDKAMKIAKPGDRLIIANTGKPYYESLFLKGDLGKDGQNFVVEGNGAVVSGMGKLDMNKFELKDNQYYYELGKKAANLNPKIYLGEQLLPETKDLKNIKPGEFAWTGSGFLFVPAAGKTIKDYELNASLRDSGVVFIGAKNVTVRNLVSEHNQNDGFNFHGSCYNLIAENIVGRNNGDDGFSVHEDGEVAVYNAEFYGNCYGIEDINASVTSYHNVKISNNQTGIHFSGGQRALVNCTLTDNVKQVFINSGTPSGYLGTDKNPGAYAGTCYIKNMKISGGDFGIRVAERAHVSMFNSEISVNSNAIELSNGCELYLTGCVISGDPAAVINQSTLLGDKNLFYPGNFKVDNKPVDFAAFLQQIKSNAESVCEEPQYDNGELRQQPFMSKSPRLKLGRGF